MKTLIKHFVFALCAVGVVACSGSHHDEATRSVGADTITIKLPQRFAPLQRPAVEFGHEGHTKALNNDCTSCHMQDEGGGLLPKLGRKTDGDDRGALVSLYHERCIGCHTKRQSEGKTTGPQTCAGCHKRQVKATSQWKAMRLDGSLHQRHVAATNNKCESCHHIYNKEQKKLVYEMGTEATCRHCHGKQDKDNTPSLRNASHQSCISCHIKNKKAKNSTGPLTCVGCHDKKAQASIKKVKEFKRLKSGQKDHSWIKTKNAKAAAVAFDHKAHEKVTPFCTSCHHETKQACGECHTPQGTLAKNGGGISLDQAQHSATSTHSCVGCHKKATAKKACDGCHHALGKPPRSSSCITCHNGSDRATVDGGPAPHPPLPVMQPIPALADKFPEKVTIDTLAKEFDPTIMPHKKHAEKLLALTKDSALASRFHGSTATLCSGCHHHTPAGSTPPSCKSCHHGDASAKADRPSLKGAYHRQCMGCHSRMGIKKLGCTDCHAKAKGAAAAKETK